MKRNTTTTLLSLLALLTLIGLGIWMGLHRSGAPQTAAQPAQGVPLDSPLIAQPIDPTIVSVVVFTGTYPVYPTVEPEPMATFDYDSVIYEPTATLTQKEEVIFDSVNGITITLPPGFHVEMATPELHREMLIRNFDIGEDPRINGPVNWIGAFIGIGDIPNQDSFEQFIMARQQEEVKSAVGTDFQIGELQPYKLGQYEGYSYDAAGTLEFPRNFTGTTFIKSLVILLPLDAGRFAQVNIQNVDSPVLAKLMQSLNTLVFAPKASP